VIAALCSVAVIAVLVLAIPSRGTVNTALAPAVYVKQELTRRWHLPFAESYPGYVSEQRIEVSGRVVWRNQVANRGIRLFTISPDSSRVLAVSNVSTEPWLIIELASGAVVEVRCPRHAGAIGYPYRLVRWDPSIGTLTASSPKGQLSIDQQDGSCSPVASPESPFTTNGVSPNPSLQRTPPG
jgi:hypothetical protein